MNKNTQIVCNKMAYFEMVVHAVAAGRSILSCNDLHRFTVDQFYSDWMLILSMHVKKFRESYANERDYDKLTCVDGSLETRIGSRAC